MVESVEKRVKDAPEREKNTTPPSPHQSTLHLNNAKLFWVVHGVIFSRASSTLLHFFVSLLFSSSGESSRGTEITVLTSRNKLK